MARIRTLKPEFFRSRSLAKVCRDARLTFQGLWCEADDFGRGVAEPRVLKGAIWPLDDDIEWTHVSEHLQQLVNTGHVRIYEVDGDAFYEISNWEEHQASAYRRGKAIYPAPVILHDQSCKEMQAARPVVHDARSIVLEHGTGNEERGASIAPAQRARDPIFDALIECWQLIPTELTDAERARVNAAAKQLRDINADPGEIPARRAMYAMLFPTAAQTMMALVNRWAECRPDPARLPVKPGKATSTVARAIARAQ